MPPQDDLGQHCLLVILEQQTALPSAAAACDPRVSASNISRYHPYLHEISTFLHAAASSKVIVLSASTVHKPEGPLVRTMLGEREHNQAQDACANEPNTRIIQVLCCCGQHCGKAENHHGTHHPQSGDSTQGICPHSKSQRARLEAFPAPGAPRCNGGDGHNNVCYNGK